MMQLWVPQNAIPSYPSLPHPIVHLYCLVPIKMIRLWVLQNAIPSYPSLPPPNIHLYCFVVNEHHQICKPLLPSSHLFHFDNLHHINTLSFLFSSKKEQPSDFIRKLYDGDALAKTDWRQVPIIDDVLTNLD